MAGHKRRILGSGSVPVRTGATFVYRVNSASGQLLYVGIADELVGRLGKHSYGSPWWREAASVEWELWPTRSSAEAEEGRIVREENPLYNVNLRGDGRAPIALPPVPWGALREDEQNRQAIAEHRNRAMGDRF